MTYKTGLVLLVVLLIIGIVGYIETSKLVHRVSARDQLINAIEQDKTSMRENNIKAALSDYARNHSLFSLSYSSAESTTEQCKLLFKIQKEEIGNPKHVAEVGLYMNSVGCQPQ